MGRRERGTSRGDDRAEHWLGSEPHGRSRPWAYEELLLGDAAAAGQREELSAFAAELAIDLAELKRMQNELYDQVVRIAGLEGRLQALRLEVRGEADASGEAGPRGDDRGEPVRSLPSDPSLPHALDRSCSLARCEGFEVESPQGLVGWVEGLRFVSRIDEPDFLEVRGGRFGRELVLIPAEAVVVVLPDEERLRIRSVPPGLHDGHAHELVHLLRRALHHETP